MAEICPLLTFNSTECSFGTSVTPTLNFYLTGDPAGSVSSLSECIQKARLQLPYLFCPSTTVQSLPESEILGASARIVNARADDRVVVMVCDAIGRPHCFEEKYGRDIVGKCTWPIIRHLYTIKNYYHFVGLLSSQYDDFRCYAVWTLSGLFVAEPIASRICSYLGVNMEPSVSIAEAVACGKPFIYGSPLQTPKCVLPIQNTKVPE